MIHCSVRNMRTNYDLWSSCVLITWPGEAGMTPPESLVSLVSLTSFVYCDFLFCSPLNFLVYLPFHTSILAIQIQVDKKHDR